MKVSEALAVYLLQLEADGKSGHTHRNYERHITLFVRVVGDVDIGSVTSGDLARFMVAPQVTRCTDGKAKQQTSLIQARNRTRGSPSHLHQGLNTGGRPRSGARPNQVLVDGSGRG